MVFYDLGVNEVTLQKYPKLLAWCTTDKSQTCSFKEIAQ